MKYLLLLLLAGCSCPSLPREEVIRVTNECLKEGVERDYKLNRYGEECKVWCKK